MTGRQRGIGGKPKITAAVVDHGPLANGQFYVDVKFTNTGTGLARRVSVDLVIALVTKGAGRVAVVSPGRTRRLRHRGR